MAMFLSACVSIDRQTAVSIRPVDGRTRIEIKVPNREMEFNWHGGGWHNLSDQFRIDVPPGAALAKGSDIRLSAAAGNTPLPVSGRSKVSVTWSPECVVDLELYDSNGKPYPFNGTQAVSSFNCVR